MAIKCPKCGNANPDNARYCWNDGIMLDAKAGLSSFRFRNGAVANSLAELGAQVDKHWDDGKYHLYSGDFANWLSAIGRGDLSSIARNIASQEKDQDIGLEKFLQSLGVDAPPHPQIALSRASLNFGKVDIAKISSGKKYTRSLKISNAGRGHLYGAVRSTESWLQVDTSDFSGNDITIRATAVRPGRHANIIISSNSGRKRIPVMMKPVHPLWKPLLICGGIGSGLGAIRLIIALIHLAIEGTLTVQFSNGAFLAGSKIWLAYHAIALSPIGAIGGAIFAGIKWRKVKHIFGGLLAGLVLGGTVGVIIGFTLFSMTKGLDYVIHPLFNFSGIDASPWGMIYSWGIVGLLTGIATGVTWWLIKIRKFLLCGIPAATLGVVFSIMWAMGNLPLGRRIVYFLLPKLIK